MDPAGRKALGVEVERLEAVLDDADLVGLVVDREVRAVAEPRRLAPQDAAARRVEGEHPHRPHHGPEQRPEPRAHLVGRLVRERDREDLVRPRPDGGDEVRHAAGQHPRLAGAGAGDDEDGALGRQHGVALRRIEVGQVLLGRENGHPSIVVGRQGAPERERRIPRRARRRPALRSLRCRVVGRGRHPPQARPRHRRAHDDPRRPVRRRADRDRRLGARDRRRVHRGSRRSSGAGRRCSSL